MSYDFSLSASGLAAAQWDDVAGLYVSQSDPTSVDGYFRGVFQNTSEVTAYNGYYTFDFTLNTDNWAVQHSADLIDVSSGGLVAHQRISVFPGYQVPLAETVRQGGRIPVSAVGLITAAAQAERVLADGAADAIFAGREWLRDPHFALRAAHELDADIAWPPQYERARLR